jgi:hypothetical protein
MSLLKTNQVDVVTFGDDGSMRLALAVYGGEWRHRDAKLLLQEKLNAYAIYALDGQMHREHPDSIGKPVKIVVRPEEPVPSKIKPLLDQFAAILAQDGLTVTVEPLPAAEAA